MDHCFKFLTFEIFLGSLSLILFSSLLNPEYLQLIQNKTRLFHVSTLLVFDWVLKYLSYS